MEPKSFSKLASSVHPTDSAMYLLKAKEYGPREKKLGSGLPSAFPSVQPITPHLGLIFLSWRLGLTPYNLYSWACGSSRIQSKPPGLM